MKIGPAVQTGRKMGEEKIRYFKDLAAIMDAILKIFPVVRHW